MDNGKELLSEIGNRIKQYRLSLNLTQFDIASRCRLSTRTISRIENGEDVKVSVLAKVLTELNLGDNFDALIPQAGLDYKAIYENRQPSKRARVCKKIPKNSASWVWGEDRKD